MTDKVDFKKEVDAYRAWRGEFRVVEVPDLRYLERLRTILRQPVRA